MDKSTKGVIYTPCAKTIDTEGMADLYMKNIWKQYGLPRKIISDRGPQFAIRFTKELWKKLGITTVLSTAYHPETDRETERVNQELKQYLHAFCNYKQTNWLELLPYAEFAHNVQQHLAMHQSPFQLPYGFNPSFAPQIEARSDIPNIKQWLENLNRIREETKASLEVAAELMKKKTIDNEVGLEEGQKVWLLGKNIMTIYLKDKLAPKLHGPFTIKKKIGPVTF